MEKKFYKSQTVLLDDATYLNGNFTLDYYILITDLNYGIGSFKKIYGIEICKRYVDFFGNCVTQNSDVKSITFNEMEIYDFANSLFEGLVTPISLKEIVADYIEQKDRIDEQEINKGA